LGIFASKDIPETPTIVFTNSRENNTFCRHVYALSMYECLENQRIEMPLTIANVSVANRIFTNPRANNISTTYKNEYCGASSSPNIHLLNKREEPSMMYTNATAQ
jgi:hypothetical protein